MLMAEELNQQVRRRRNGRRGGRRVEGGGRRGESRKDRQGKRDDDKRQKEGNMQNNGERREEGKKVGAVKGTESQPYLHTNMASSGASLYPAWGSTDA